MNYFDLQTAVVLDMAALSLLSLGKKLSPQVCFSSFFLRYHEGGDALYLLKPETCCGGACVACNCCSGKGLVYMPFYFHDPNSQEVIGGKSLA